MRIVVLSDTHKDFFTAKQIVDRHLTDADCFINLGDGEKEWDDLRTLYPEKKMYYVKGNCDLASIEPETGFLSVGEHKILYTHGHLYSVKATLDRLIDAARQCGCDIALFGHTHASCVYYEDGLYLFNPGSPSRPTDSKPGYGIVDITDAGVVCNKVSLEPRRSF